MTNTLAETHISGSDWDGLANTCKIAGKPWHGHRAHVAALFKKFVAQPSMKHDLHT